jgi:hypothetical protein
MAAGFVRLWGDDANDGLTEAKAKRTLQGATDAALSPKDVTGYYVEQVSGNIQIVNGTGYCVFDGVLKTNFAGSSSGTSGAVFKSYTSYNGQNTNGYNVFDALRVLSSTQSYASTRKNDFNLFINNGTSLENAFGFAGQNNTYHNGWWKFFDRLTAGFLANNIYSNLQLHIATPTYITQYIYSLFINSTFKFTGGAGVDEVSFTAPTGADDDAKLANLRDRMVVAYLGVASDYLLGCKYYSGSYDDIFVNADNGDFTLLPNSLAANLAYDGSYIGAKGIGYNIEFNTDFNSIVNISETASTLGYVEDQETDATCISNIIDLGVVKNINNLSNLGLLATRNGMQLNTVTNLGVELSAGTALTELESYLVVNNTVTYNSITYNPWDTFQCLTGITAFTGSGQCREVDQDAYPEKLQIKTSKTDPTLSGVATLTLYTIDDIEINEDANGIPTLGNADAGYVPGSAVNLDTRYIQIIVTIKAENLPAR